MGNCCRGQMLIMTLLAPNGLGIWCMVHDDVIRSEKLKFVKTQSQIMCNCSIQSLTYLKYNVFLVVDKLNHVLRILTGFPDVEVPTVYTGCNPDVSLDRSGNAFASHVVSEANLANCVLRQVWKPLGPLFNSLSIES